MDAPYSGPGGRWPVWCANTTGAPLFSASNVSDDSAAIFPNLVYVSEIFGTLFQLKFYPPIWEKLLGC